MIFLGEKENVYIIHLMNHTRFITTTNEDKPHWQLCTFRCCVLVQANVKHGFHDGIQCSAQMEKYQPLFNCKSSPKPGEFLYGRYDIVILNPDPLIYYQQKTAHTTFLVFF